MEKKRIIWIDVLNIIACMGVLLLHCTNGEIHNFSGEITLNWIIGLCTHSFMLWPVNVFFMLSGFTLIKPSIIEMGGVKRFFTRRINRLLVPVLTWNTIYLLIQILSQWYKGDRIDTPLVIIDKYLSFQYNGFMWFFIPLICLYLSMPFLSFFVLNARGNILKLFIVAYLIMNTVGCLSQSKGAHFYDIYIFGTRFLLFAVAGYYFGNYDISGRARRKLYALGYIGVLVIFVGTALLQLYMPNRYDLFLKYTNIPCTIIAFAVFVYGKYTNWSKVLSRIKISESMLVKLSSLSLGIYLFQAIGFRLIGKFESIDDCLILKFILMYILSVCVVTIMKHIPLINKIV